MKVSFFHAFLFFLYRTAKKSTSFIAHVLRFFFLISSFFSLSLRSTFRKSLALDPTAANVKRDFQEMAKRTQVSVDYYLLAILYKSRSAFLSLHKKV